MLNLTEATADWISSLQGDKRWLELEKVLNKVVTEKLNQITRTTVSSDKDLATHNHLVGEIKGIQMVIGLPESAKKMLNARLGKPNT